MFAAHHSLTSFPSILPLVNFRVTVHLSSYRRLEKKELEVTRGVEDHIKIVAVCNQRRSGGCAQEGRISARRGEAKVGPVQCNSVDLRDWGEECVKAR